MPVRIIFISLLILTAIGAGAQEPALIPPSGTLGAGCNFITGEFDFECIPIYIGYLVQVVFAASGGFALIEILKSGYQIAMGGLTGDKERGKQRLTWALIGLAFCILAFVIVDYVVTTLIVGP
ncbi:hypothetical protein HYZ99_02280 [Candidatus Peregrinibacteria bacterium]|nr:hypothetical protein [Candidatus Peregrinibacteria bacterium]